MDLQATGNFIKEQRKQAGLTQTQLAEKLAVSEKTVSKWECGNGFPDTAIMLPLCEVLKVSANELLSGKKIEEKDYKTEAEKNLIDLNERHEDTTKFLLKLEIVLGFMVCIPFFAFIMIAALVQMPDWVRIVGIVLSIVYFIFGMHFCMLIEKDAGFYECRHCHHKYIPTLKSVYCAMHINRTRFMRCPKCGKKSWQKKVVK